MSIHERLNDLLDAIDDDLDLDVETDGKVFVFSYDDLYECSISADEANDHVEFRTLLCIIDETSRERVYEEALRLNLNREQTEGAIIALSDDVLLLRSRHPAQSLDQRVLAGALAQFIAVARQVRGRLADAGADAVPAGGIPFARDSDQFVVIRP